MLFKKKGFPEVGELVLCKVTKVQFHSVFVRLEEYEHKDGLIHISEISPGRIRNIRDYVKEGKVIVCVVLRVNMERSQIDLSFRRVNEAMRKNKINAIKQLQISEKIIEHIARNNKMDTKDLYEKVMSMISDDYENLYHFFEEVVQDEKNISRLKIDPKVRAQLLEVIHQRIKLPEVTIAGKLDLKCYSEDGVNVIKDVLTEAERIGGEGFHLSYLGAGKYDIKVKAGDYKDAEKVLKEAVDHIINNMEKKEGIVSFSRID
jgi:translation initiation factor 2 subunit 1